MTKAITFSESNNAESKVLENQEIILETSIVTGGFTFRNCSINNVDATINNCTFENCKIDCAGLTNCTLTNCNVSAYDIGITNCKFVNPQMLTATRCSIASCAFADIFCDNDAVIFPEDSKIINCRFANVKLCNDAYLISGVGDCCVSNCQFEGIFTDRDDLQIIYCEDTTGKLIKKTKEYDIVESNCKGLDTVKSL